MDARTHLGNTGETAVVKYLEDRGFTIIARNYRQRYGEIDLIAQQKDLIAFVEVKMRRNNAFDLSEVIVPSKQRKIITVAKHYLARTQSHNVVCRFDVALVHATPTITIEYLENAFQDETPW